MWSRHYSKELFSIKVRNNTKLVSEVLFYICKIITVVMTFSLFHTSESYHYSTSMLRQHKFLSSLVEKLGKPETAQEVSVECINVVHDMWD